MPGPILPVSSIPSLEISRPSAAKGKGGFQDVLADAIGDVERTGNTAAQSVERFLSGEGEDLHTTAMAAQRAELSFDLFLQARNKVVQAYQEIMRMQM